MSFVTSILRAIPLCSLIQQYNKVKTNNIKMLIVKQKATYQDNVRKQQQCKIKKVIQQRSPEFTLCCKNIVVKILISLISQLYNFS